MILTLRLLSAGLALGATLAAQAPRVGVIEIFGARRTPVDRIRKVLGFSEGDPLPTSRSELEQRIQSVDGVVSAAVEAACCEDRRAVLYIGIEERGAPRFEYHTPPSLDLELPADVQSAWLAFAIALDGAIRRGTTAEDLTQGHSLMADPSVRAAQTRFVALAAEHLPALREVLRKSGDEQQRGIAAYVLGYQSNKTEALNDLQYALRDPDPTVRNNAMRGLLALMVLARRKPELELKVSPTWLIELLHSVHFTDRIKASEALFTFTETRDAATLAHLKERSLAPLLEMARWRSLEHALPAFYLLGRIAGLSEEAIQDLWKQGKREELLQQFKTDKRTR